MESIRSRSAKLRSSATVLSSRETAMSLVWDVAKETKKFNSDPHFIRVKIKMRPSLVFFLNYIGTWHGIFCLIDQTLHFEIKQKYRDMKESEVNLPESLRFVSTFSKERAASNGSIEGRTQLSKTWSKRRGRRRLIDIMASSLRNRFRNFPQNRIKTKEEDNISKIYLVIWLCR